MGHLDIEKYKLRHKAIQSEVPEEQSNFNVA
jgi:hypothetical protein